MFSLTNITILWMKYCHYHETRTINLWSHFFTKNKVLCRLSSCGSSLSITAVVWYCNSLYIVELEKKQGILLMHNSPLSDKIDQETCETWHIIKYMYISEEVLDSGRLFRNWSVLDIGFWCVIASTHSMQPRMNNIRVLSGMNRALST